MAVPLLSFPSLQVLFLLLLFVSAACITAQSPEGTNFTCSVDETSPCETYVAYLAQSPNFLNLGNISDLFAVSRLAIASASNLVSEDTSLIPDQLLLVPVNCGCTGNHFFARITYQIKHGDNYYLVSTTSFENLTNWEAVKVLNPKLDPNLLHPGDKVIFPLFCKCPSKTHLKNGIQYLITYVWQPDDDVFNVAAKLNASPHDIAIENNYRDFSVAVHHPLLIPVTQLPVLSQPSPFLPQRRKHHGIIIVVASITGVLLIFLLLYFLVHVHCSGNKKKKNMALCRSGSFLESADLLQRKELKKYESSEPKIIQGKLLPGVSGYLGKPIMYDVKEIMKATMDLHEHYRIGGSVYRANINGQVLSRSRLQELAPLCQMARQWNLKYC